MQTSLPLRILIIDDNEASAKTLGWMLELLGHKVRIAYDGQSGMEVAREFKPDIVMLDIGLPMVNGYEICEAMQKEPQFKNTIFIAQTGWGQQEHRERSREAGFEYHMVKPVQLHELQEVFHFVTQKLEGKTISGASPITERLRVKR